MPRFYNELKRIENTEVRSNIPLKDFTTFRIGGKALYFIFPGDNNALENTVSILNNHSRKFYILGGGSNLLVNERDFEIIVSLNKLNNITDVKENGDAEVFVTFYAGLSLKKAIAWLLQNGFSGFEDLTGIPGSIGGAIKMNAGVRDFSVSENLKEVLILEKNSFKWIKKEDINFGYRKSSFSDDIIIIAGRFFFKKSEQAEIRNKIMHKIHLRNKTQPISKASAGCIFKNFSDMGAGKLIDVCGLKGKSRGDATVSPIHANFIINRGNASFNDVIILMDQVREIVYKKTGYFLQNEVKIWY